jgi:hypothetical protein
MIRKIFILFAIIVGFASCSAQFHLRRAVAKDPSLLKSKTIHKTIIDSVFVQDTIKMPGVDTVFSFLPIKNEWKIAYEDNRAKLQIMKGENGNLKFRLSEKPLVIYYNAVIPHVTEVSFEVPPIAEVKSMLGIRDYFKWGIALIVLFFLYNIFIRK